MTTTRTADSLAEIKTWVEDFADLMGRGARSARIQFDVDGHTDPFTIYANKNGTFIVEPGSKPVPATEWLSA